MVFKERLEVAIVTMGSLARAWAKFSEALPNNLFKFNQGLARESDRLTLLAGDSSLSGAICVNLEEHLGRVIANYGISALGFSVLRIAFESLLCKVSYNRHALTLTRCTRPADIGKALWLAGHSQSLMVCGRFRR